MIAILGSSGMLGSMFVKKFGLKFTAYNHSQFDAELPNFDLLRRKDWIINCIGITKPFCDDVLRAITVNAQFPHLLPARTIQIATDCVYSGLKGNYVESDPHDAFDVYGQTKSLGEASHIRNLRCSIIGPEMKNHHSLHDWFFNQTEANGFTNHYWNGITTYHFVKICEGVIKNKLALPSLQHIVPADKVSKNELLHLLKKHSKSDISILDIEAPNAVDRTLATNRPDLNKLIWQAAGYPEPPTIEQMVMELAAL